MSKKAQTTRTLLWIVIVLLAIVILLFIFGNKLGIK